MEYAILMAAGLGTRMRPLTEKKPKPLISIDGKPLIETVIEGLKCRKDLKGIYVVVGYLGEQFDYLCQKYSDVYIINNYDYQKINNISSVYSAREVLRKGNCFICEADLFVFDKHIFDREFESSLYFGKYVNGKTEDWVFDVGADGYITRVGKVGENCYAMCGISYFLKEDANILADVIEKRYGTIGYEQLFWDDVVNENLDMLKLKIFPVKNEQIIEIDTVEELNAVCKGLEKENDKKSSKK